MTPCRLGVFAPCLLLLASFGCRQAELRSSAGLWESDIVVAPSTPVADIKVEAPPNSSVASVEPAGVEFIEAPAPQREEYELPGEPTGGDVQFELLDDANPAIVAESPPCDFLATLSPGARRFFDDGNAEFDPPSRLAIVRHQCGEDIRCGWHRLLEDHRNYYSWDGLGMFVVGFGLGAAVANTNADQELQQWYQDDVRTDLSNDFSRWAKFSGEGWFVAAIATTGWVAGEALYDRPVGGVLAEWGGRTLRSTAVGTPPMLLMQNATGASRPVENVGSKWRPFDDDNGVSGHGFLGALPFINAAKMSDNIPLKVGFYACSFTPGWSRMNDDSHFTSQVLLGWWMAYWAATAVDLTNRNEQSQWSVATVAMGDGTAMGLVYCY